MCYYRNISADGTLSSSITVFGNPAIFWTGIISLIYIVYVTIKRVSLESAFILSAFLGLYLPYVFVGRQMFIYHYYYAVPFMILSIIFMLKDIRKYFPKYAKYSFLYFGIVVFLFLAYYPVLSGYEIPKTYLNYALRWFPGWWL
jgi:dolichyl-phosphate-mannose-protein mannosyltransferase